MVTVPRFERQIATTAATPGFSQVGGAGDARAFGASDVDPGTGFRAVASAAEQIQNTKDATARGQDAREARKQLKQLFQAEQLSGSDFANRQNVEQFETNARGVIEQTLANHSGSQRSAAVLSEQLEREYQTLIDAGAARGQATIEANLKQDIGQEIDNLATAAVADPSSMHEQFSILEDQVNNFYGDALTPADQQAFINAGKSQIVTETINSMLAQPGGIDSASNLLLDPEIRNVLTPKQRIELRNRVLSTERELERARMEGSLVRTKIAGALGVPESEVPDELVMRGMKIQGQSEKLIEVGDPSSPTGSRFVPESQASGQPGRPRTPLVVNDQEPAFRKEMGKLEAQRVGELNTSAQQAFRDRDEFARMEAALDSEQFKTGVFADTRIFISRFAEWLDIPQDNEIFNLIGNATQGDTLDAATARLAVSEAEKLGRITNMSLQFVERSLPNLFRTTSGNRILIKMMQRSAQRQIELADVANEYANTFGTLNPTRKQWEEEMGSDVPYTTYNQAQAILEQNNPVVDEEMRKQIQAINEDPNTPKSFEQAFERQVPPGLPKGSRPTGQKTDTGAAVWIDPKGNKWKVR